VERIFAIRAGLGSGLDDESFCQPRVMSGGRSSSASALSVGWMWSVERGGREADFSTALASGRNDNVWVSCVVYRLSAGLGRWGWWRGLGERLLFSSGLHLNHDAR